MTSYEYLKPYKKICFCKKNCFCGNNLEKNGSKVKKWPRLGFLRYFLERIGLIVGIARKCQCMYGVGKVETKEDIITWSNFRNAAIKRTLQV